MFDPFGHAHIRRVERELISEYRDQLRRTVASVTSGSDDTAVALADAPDMIRGYEEVSSTTSTATTPA
jgi:indolepyruvate ferredoxin oxidoreductase